MDFLLNSHVIISRNACGPMHTEHKIFQSAADIKRCRTDNNYADVLSTGGVTLLSCISTSTWHFLLLMKALRDPVAANYDALERINCNQKYAHFFFPFQTCINAD